MLLLLLLLYYYYYYHYYYCYPRHGQRFIIATLAPEPQTLPQETPAQNNFRGVGGGWGYYNDRDITHLHTYIVIPTYLPTDLHTYPSTSLPARLFTSIRNLGLRPQNPY